MNPTLRLKSLTSSLAQTFLASRASAPAFADEFRRELAQRSDGTTARAANAAAAAGARALLLDRWARTQAADAKDTARRRVHYLSMEFLMGRALTNAIAALDLSGELSRELDDQPIADVREQEPDAALGNGGLGRLAACFLDSFATLGLKSFGYGLRYRHGMFTQKIQDGQQTEVPDTWLADGNPWEVARPEVNYRVGLGGVVHAQGGARRWVAQEEIIARAYDFIVPGHHTERVSTLRLWHSEAAAPIDFASFCRGDHASSAAHIQAADALNWVLYPDDSTPGGRALRLKQEYVLVSASLQDMLARHLSEGRSIDAFGRDNCVHLNDTHPALAPAELMRLLLDEHGLTWEAAWAITSDAVSYTNHTLMPEALETWPVHVLQALLPRHLEIIYEINRRFLAEVEARFAGDVELVKRLSLIDEQGERRVRMAHLAIVASNKVNGVSALHSQLMVDTIFSDFAKLWPDRFINVTNGVTPRRWLEQANPALAQLLDGHIGSLWRRDAVALGLVTQKRHDRAFGRAFLATKLANKQRLAELIRRQIGVTVDPTSLFDVQVKRIHEYKRQLLNVLHVIHRYQAIRANPSAHWQPRTVIFAGKAASAYHAAKLIIRLIHDVARVVNTDPLVAERLKVVFLPNYSVSLAEAIIPAADLSEQISTAGTEASGTGNMKFALNGALTIGTWDGANIEMAEAMGVDNMFVFGLTAAEVSRLKSLGYDPSLYVQQDKALAVVLRAVADGTFSHGDESRYHALVNPLVHHDPYLLLADFANYVETQAKVDALFADSAAWAERALANIAGMGHFSTDRTIGEYVAKVWS